MSSHSASPILDAHHGLLIANSAIDLARLSVPLEEAGFHCLACQRSDSLQALVTAQPEFVVFDHDPPDPEAWQLLTRLVEFNVAPVLVVSELAPQDSTARALRMGAEVFLRKPIGAEELVARVEVLLRRRGGERPPPAFIGGELIEIDLLRHTVRALEREVELTPTEFRLLVALASHPGEVLSQAQLIELAWPDSYRQPSEVKLYVSYLRRSLRQVAAIDPVETVRGIGYRYLPRLVGAT